MKIRHFLLLVVVLMSSLAVGCSPAGSEMDYLAAGGRAEVTGVMNGLAFSAVIELSGSGEILRVEYISPTSLQGLILTAKGEECEVKLGDVCFTCGTEEVTGFLRPVSVFLPQGDANTVQKEGENTVLTFPCGGALTLSPEGEPLSFAREDIEMRVVWWESGAEEKNGS